MKQKLEKVAEKENAAKKLSDAIIESLLDKKGVEIVRMNLGNVVGAITDYFVICTGTSDKHVQALAGSVVDQIKKENKERPLSMEGFQQGEWILIDYVNVVVHVFLEEKRKFYNIEDLWGDAKFEKIKIAKKK